MPNTPLKPTITVEYDMAVEAFVLMAHGRGEPAIVGERIFRAEPWPSISSRHPSQESAERDAAVLRKYLDWAYDGRKEPEVQVGRDYWIK